ncbi:electron transporter RnfB [Photobacterium jeanii]|uniref:Electron transfer flavoprotein subunit beta n=1 Tax=Photobacterium jeanii TaxID=858640 RepID=A0A178K7T9_9GAMM|nr:electron transfer flavoprotein subunit beta/FixA family protein [Photobacterium jeanii]OAN13136.1 electron transporter RnfB [Photobacterium jeanii]PST89288.1 electron transfer flavoprotein subunit beta/FixA family protein [Photobacterium jeanii]
MKILVAIKRVIDPYVKIRVKPDGSGVEDTNVKMAMNPFCEIAVEEAIRLKEAGHANEVVVVSIGDQACQEQLRNALALGADRAIQVETENTLEPLAVAKVLQAVVGQEQPQLILLGKQSIDSDNNQVPQMLAALLGLPQATFASELVMSDDTVTVTREVDGGLETLNLTIPAVISTDLRLNEPRYASLPNIMKAKRKPLDVLPLDTLNIVTSARQAVDEVMVPPARQAGIRVGSVLELVNKLKNEAKVIE